jgi:hypothetical protein
LKEAIESAQTNPYKDFGRLEEGEKFLSHTENKYKEILKNGNKGEINFFEDLNAISKEIASEFDK